MLKRTPTVVLALALGACTTTGDPDGAASEAASAPPAAPAGGTALSPAACHRLVGGLDTENADEATAIRSRLRAAGTGAIPSLISGATSLDRRRVDACVDLLVDLGEPAIAPVLDALAATELHDVVDLVQAFLELMPGMPPDAFRYTSPLATVLVRLGADAPAALAQLRTIARGDRAFAALSAAAALIELEPPAQPPNAARDAVARWLAVPEHAGLAARVGVSLGARATPLFSAALDASDPDVRHAALAGLARLGPAARPVQPRLVEIGDVGETALQRSALVTAYAVAPDSPAGRAAGERLVAILTDADDVRTGPAHEHGWSGRPLAAPGFKRAELGMQLGQLGDAAVPLLLRVVADDDPHARALAVLSLGQCASPAASAAVRAALDDPSLTVAIPAALAFATITDDPAAIQPVLARLVDRLAAGDSAATFDRITASLAVLLLGREDGLALPALRRMLREDIAPGIALTALTLNAANARAARTEAAAWLDHSEPRIRRQALVALVTARSDPGDPVEHLLAALHDRSPRVREAAWEHLEELADELASARPRHRRLFERLVAALDGLPPQSAWSAAQVLEGLGPSAGPDDTDNAAGAVHRRLLQARSGTRVGLVAVLGELGAGFARTAIETVLKDGTPAEQEAATEALAQLDG